MLLWHQIVTTWIHKNDVDDQNKNDNNNYENDDDQDDGDDGDDFDDGDYDVRVVLWSRVVWGSWPL